MHTPWHFATFHHVLKHLPISESIHRPPEALILIGHEMPAFDQAIEGLKHQLFARSDIIEDLVAKHEIATVDPDLGLVTRAQSLHGTLLIKFRKMEADRRMNGEKAADLPTLLEAIDHVRQWRVCQSVAIVR